MIWRHFLWFNRKHILTFKYSRHFETTWSPTALKLKWRPIKNHESSYLFWIGYFCWGWDPLRSRAETRDHWRDSFLPNFPKLRIRRKDHPKNMNQSETHNSFINLSPSTNPQCFDLDSIVLQKAEGVRKDERIRLQNSLSDILRSPWMRNPHKYFIVLLKLLEMKGFAWPFLQGNTCFGMLPAHECEVLHLEVRCRTAARLRRGLKQDGSRTQAMSLQPVHGSTRKVRWTYRSILLLIPIQLCSWSCIKHRRCLLDMLWIFLFMGDTCLCLSCHLSSHPSWTWMKPPTLGYWYSIASCYVEPS